MRRSSLAVLVVALAFLSTACDIHAHGSAVEGSFDRTIPITGGADVSVWSRSGSIRVTAGASDQVHVAARIRASGSYAYAPAEQVQELESAPPIRLNGSSISIGQINDPWLSSGVSISYDVTVPSDTTVHTSSRSGNQTIAALKGPLDAVSRSGNIRVDDVSGPLRLGSRSGDVTVDGAPYDHWDIATRSGDVSLRMPSTAAFNVDVETRSGSIRTPQGFESEGAVSRKWFKGRVRGGGTGVSVGTRSGSITIE